MSKPDGQEEQFVLRVVEPAIADKLRNALRQGGNLADQLKLSFLDNGRQGTITIDGVNYPVHVLDLPSTVESYKTYDDQNLVKTGDVGQVLLVGQLPAPQLAELTKAQQTHGPAGPVESLDGITPPMRSARSRHLRPRLDVPAKVVTQVEEAVMDILDGHAFAGAEFEDIEEEYVVDQASGRGRWKQVVKADHKDRGEKGEKAEKGEKEGKDKQR